MRNGGTKKSENHPKPAHDDEFSQREGIEDQTMKKFKQNATDLEA